MTGTGPRDSKGWDGKLRIEKRAVLASSDCSDGDVPVPEEIAADEDLLDDHDLDTDDIDLVHRGITSIPSLRLERFSKIERLCLRQNQISHLDFPDSLGPMVKDLDLYDNLISHLKGLESFVRLTTLDLSFNKLKHIKNIGHLHHLTDLYLIQNKISRIEGLEGLNRIRNLELAANRIRNIENLESLNALEELWLGKNKITELNNLSSLTNLKILSVQSNRLTHLSGLSSLNSLEELYVSHNALTEISGLDQNLALRVIDISNNQIHLLQGLKHLTQLEEVWASNNQLASFQEIEKELADKENLSTVYFEGNTLQKSNPVLYRNKVRLALPQVKQIDATFVQVS